MSCSRLLNPKTQRLQFLPPRIPKRVNQLNLSIFARRVSPNRGASCPLTRQKLGKSDTDNQSHWASPASCPNLFIAAKLYISQLYIWTLYIWKQLYTLGNYTHYWATIHRSPRLLEAGVLTKSAANICNSPTAGGGDQTWFYFLENFGSNPTSSRMDGGAKYGRVGIAVGQRDDFGIFWESS